MGRLGFFDLSLRYERLEEKNDPLVAIAAIVPFEAFREKLKAALVSGGLRASAAARKSAAGRKPWDEVLMFKALVLQALYNLSDDQAEYQLRDRLSFMRFLGLGLEDVVPDAKTPWLYREALAKAGAVEELFDMFDRFLKEKGYLAMGGQIIGATIVTAPKQHNKREENEAVKAGETPREWKDKPAKNRQKDKDARRTKKHGRCYFGYKNHVNVDRRHKFIRRYDVTSASVHDSQKLDDVLDQSNTASDVWAGSAYRSKEIEEKLRARGLKSHVCRRGACGRPLTERQQEANRTRSKVRARVEHVFGQQTMTMGAKIVRTVGMARARMKIGMQNLAYNMRRFVTLERVAAATAWAGRHRPRRAAQNAPIASLAEPNRGSSGGGISQPSGVRDNRRSSRCKTPIFRAAHTLGFPHEHMRREIVDRIDQEKAFAYYWAYDHWDRNQVMAQVLTPISNSALTANAPPDSHSIMCYGLPAGIMKDGVAVPGGMDIDEMDAQFAALIYPKQASAATLYPGENLRPGQSLQSKNRLHTLIMQTDGNVVLYDRQNHPHWATHTQGITPREFVMQPDGNLVLYSTDGHARWNSNTWNNPGTFLDVQDDGNLVVYKAGSRSQTAENALWAVRH